MDRRWIKRSLQFSVYPVFAKILSGVVFFALYACIEMQIEIPLLGADFEFSQGVHTLLGVSLSMLLVFRNNSSYDRWWEGRKLWGQLVNTCRSLALLITCQGQLEGSEKEAALALIRRFPFELRDHLRGPWPATYNQPVHTLAEMIKLYGRWDFEGKLQHNNFLRVEHHLTELSNVMGACERIRSTPLPLSHRAIIPQVMIAYLLALPWGLPDHVTSILIEAVMAYFLLSLEMVSEMLEEPFGSDSDDLPLTRISKTIEKSLEQIGTFALRKPAPVVSVSTDSGEKSVLHTAKP